MTNSTGTQTDIDYLRPEGGRPKNRAAFTICSWNYLSYARTFASSFKRHNPYTDLYIFIADRSQPYSEALDGLAKVIVIDRNVVLNFELMAASYSILEYNTAVKPFCIDYLMHELGFDCVCYLDPDILVTSALDEVFDFLDSEFDCVLTPHITRPYDDNLHPGELDILRSGIFNLGFIGIAKRRDAIEFLNWWKKWLETDCIVDIANGIFVDQKFCDFTPIFIENTLVLRDPGYNLAYWNLMQRPLSVRDGILTCGGSVIRFVHFSGVDKALPNIFSKHQNRFKRENIGLLQPIYDNYLNALISNDIWREVKFSQVPYGFDKLTEGIPSTYEVRRCIRRYRDDFNKVINDENIREFLTTASDQIPLNNSQPINRLVWEIFAARGDLQATFNILTPNGRSLLINWARQTIAREYGLSADLAECASDVDLSNEPSLNEEYMNFHSTSIANGLPRAAKLVSFLLSRSLLRTTYSEHALEDLAWNLAYSYNLLPRKVAERLYDELVGSNATRRNLFSHWLRERGQEPFVDLSAGRCLREVGGSQSPLTRGLAIYGFLNTETGVGQAGRSFSQAFATTDLPLSCHSITAPGYENNVEFPSGHTLDNSLDTAMLALNADNIMNIDNFIERRLIEDKRRIGVFFWELPVFPGMWSRSFDYVDEIVVSSQFIAEGISSTTHKPIHIISLPVPLNLRDSRESRIILDLPLDRLLYLITFDYNSFPSRKNPIGAVRAFIDAFPVASESTPILIVKFHGLNNRGAYADELRTLANNRKNIILIDRVMSCDEILMLQAAIDVYVSLHRSEGFGLGIAECMAAGKLVVATNFSGNTDFMHCGNSIPVPYAMRRVEPGEYVAWQGQWWAEPDHDFTVDALKRATLDEYRSGLCATARTTVEEQLSYEVVGREMKKRLFG